MSQAENPENPVVLFDGVCNLCNGVVRFIFERDEEERFRFAPLQSDKGEELAEEFGIDAGELSTFVLIDEGEAYTRSDAFVELLRELGGKYRWISRILDLFPGFLRDLGYRLVARSRYRVFGRRDACMVPSGEVRERFLDY